MADEHFDSETFVTVFSSHHFDAESEADTVQALLKSSGLESMIVRENVPELPTGAVEVRVLEHDAEAAKRVIRAAKDAAGR